jgi:hypothetical protein
MAALKDKLENALNEARILILGVTVLLGFDLRAPYESAFERLPPAMRYTKLGTLTALMGVVILLVAPAAYHRVVEKGAISTNFHSFINTMMRIALPLIAAILAGEFFFAAARIYSIWIAQLIAWGIVLIALALWYGFEALPQRTTSSAPKRDERRRLELSDQVKEVLMEARVVLPGAQALLGFQFIAVLNERFDKLPAAIKQLHFGSLCAVGVCTIVLMAVPAYHRIVDQGEDTRRIVTFASRCILCALAALGLGMAGDFGVGVWMITRSSALTWIAAVGAALLSLGIWFALMHYLRRRRRTPAEDLEHAA